MDPLRIATRKSPLALWQANFVAQGLCTHHPDLSVELVKMTTTGDRMLSATLASAGGKGLFMKELEISLLDNRADIAVHSMKDVVVTLSEQFEIAAICERDDPFDALVSNDYDALDQLPAGARVGTCSLRRQCLIRHLHPHLEVVNLRGNVNTRLAKLDHGEYAAIVLAASGLDRLGLSERIRQRLPAELLLPAVGQGAIGIQCKKTDAWVRELLQPLDHAPTRRCVEAERAMNAELEGGCHVPIAGFARNLDQGLYLDGLVGKVDGSSVIRAKSQASPEQPVALGRQVAEELIANGAHEILRSVYASH